MNSVKIFHDTTRHGSDSVNAKVFVNDVEVKCVKTLNTFISVDSIHYEVEIETVEERGRMHSEEIFDTIVGPNNELDVRTEGNLKHSILSFEAHVEVVRDAKPITWGDIFKK
jgi:hypothetical protein